MAVSTQFPAGVRAVEQKPGVGRWVGVSGRSFCKSCSYWYYYCVFDQNITILSYVLVSSNPWIRETSLDAPFETSSMSWYQPTGLKPSQWDIHPFSGGKQMEVLPLLPYIAWFEGIFSFAIPSFFPTCPSCLMGSYQGWAQEAVTTLFWKVHSKVELMGKMLWGMRMEN